MGVMGCSTLQRISSDSTHSTLMPLPTVSLFPNNQAAVFRQTSEPCPGFVPVQPLYSIMPQMAAVQQQAIYGTTASAVQSLYAPAPLLTPNDSNAGAPAAPAAITPFMLAQPLPLNGSMADTIALNLNTGTRIGLQVQQTQMPLPPASGMSKVSVTVPSSGSAVAVAGAGAGGHYAVVSGAMGVKPATMAAAGRAAGSRTITLKPPKSSRRTMDTSLTTVSSVAEELAGVLDPLKHQPLVPLSQLLGSPTDNSSSDAAAQMHGGGAGRGDAPGPQPGSSEGCTTDTGICHFSALPPNPDEPREAACEVPLYNSTGVQAAQRTFCKYPYISCFVEGKT